MTAPWLATRLKTNPSFFLVGFTTNFAMEDKTVCRNNTVNTHMFVFTVPDESEGSFREVPESLRGAAFPPL
jgi:hypothetical protein